MNPLRPDSARPDLDGAIVREETPRPPDPVSPLALWSGALVPPFAVLVAQMGAYAFVPPVCERGLSPVFVHLPHALMLVVALAATLMSARHHRRFAHAQDEGHGVAARSKLIASIGVYGGPYFALIIVGMWSALAVIGQCQ